jgi:hypothetical protein
MQHSTESCLIIKFFFIVVEPEQKSEPYGATLFLYGPEQDFDVALGAPKAPALASFLITSISDLLNA